MSNRIQALHDLGQSIWYDNIERGMLENGTLAALIQRGDIRGITSNPTIFNAAIGKTHDYDAALKPMAWAGWPGERIFYQLAVEDIREAADLFRPLYEQTNGGDGYVSLEVSPYLAHDTDATVAEAQRLWAAVDRPNLMVKIPATREGIEAIRRCIADGMNINVTLIFSLERYDAVMDAYLRGLEERAAAGQSIDRIASVASFFVSRMDSKVDPRLEALIQASGPQAEAARGLLGKAAIANARLAYQHFLRVFHAEQRFTALQARGARIQRPLWASTSTKNPAYRDVLYVEELGAAETVNTVPPKTLDAFRDHGQAQDRISHDLPGAQAALDGLERLGISVAAVTQELEDEGVKSFADSFTELLATVEQRRLQALDELGDLAAPVAERVKALDDSGAMRRMFARDGSLWTQNQAAYAEIQQRLGWLELPFTAVKAVPDLIQFRDACITDGFTHALLLGMGGSSLCPETLRLIFGVEQLGLDLAILDSTDPGQVAAAAARSAVENTLFIVSSKSGGTSEINAFLDFFWERAGQTLGAQAGQHFVAITDPGTSLEKLARERGFRQVFLADPTVGGRYSALTMFGLAPAALLGIDLERYLSRAAWMARQSAADVPAGRNPGMVLGAVMGEAALRGCDKLTLLADPELAPLGAWLEQLVAESSGKENRGIVPIDLEPVANPQDYSSDRLFVYLSQSGYRARQAQALRLAGHPVLVLNVPAAYDLAAEFYRWEVATAIACAVLGVNAFDQPDVQDSKTRTAQKMAEYQARQAFDEGAVIWENPQARLYGAKFSGLEDADSLSEAIHGFLKRSQPGDYIAINAYLPRNERTLDQLQNLRAVIQRQTGRATTLGFGPRFLHSTGQLHKGGPDTGVFLQITADPEKDLPIPGRGITFGMLERAQALGDFEALQARGRRILRVHLKDAGIDDCCG